MQVISAIGESVDFDVVLPSESVDEVMNPSAAVSAEKRLVPRRVLGPHD